MIKYLITKEFLYAMLATLLVFSIFNRFNFVIIEPTEEQMSNVQYNYETEKDFNIH